MTVPVRIRAHHLLCMQGFQGYGYNDDFANHMNNIVTQLKNDTDMLVQVTIDCDDICDGCPHHKENMCHKDVDADNRIKLMDSIILKCTGIKSQSIDSIKSIIACINNTFNAKIQLMDICGDCQWIEKCKWYMSLT